MAEFQRQKLYSPHSLPPSHGWKRRREESDEEEEEEEKEEETAPQAEDTWVVDSLYGLKMKLKRRRVSSVLTEHHEVFTRLLGTRSGSRHIFLASECSSCPSARQPPPRPDSANCPRGSFILLFTLQGPHTNPVVLPNLTSTCLLFTEDPVIKKFLAWDKHLRLSDKYLLSMVIAYFSRAGLFSWQYQQIHFFIALYLASDMEEDNQAPKQAIFSFLYGRNRFQRPLFHKLRFQFLRSMRWRTRVTREECEEVDRLWGPGAGSAPWEGQGHGGTGRRIGEGSWAGGMEGRPPGGCVLRHWLAVFQIQAFDPELWVWGRDRTLLPEESARTMEA
uniref:Speedy/RINGO cell cycle regulator family member E4 n=1 Tax=Suricata suricatta TaxID=37032 RepID=A0A673VHA7_SURSU